MACDVCPTGCAFSSVQSAVEAADAGDTIQLCPGAFGRVVIDKDLTMLGAGDDPGGTTLDGQGAAPVVTVNIGATVMLERVVITGGQTTSDGGGIINRGTLTLTNCTIRNNRADFGGAILNRSGADLTMDGCTIRDNDANAHAGLLNSGTSATGPTTTARLTNCLFTQNRARFGGGIDNESFSSLTATDCSITDNDGPGVFNRGGATVTMTGCIISGHTNDFNTSNARGVKSEGRVELTGCAIRNNVGGGIWVERGSASLTDCTISGNQTAPGDAGAGGLFQGDDVAMAGCIVTDNTAEGSGGGIAGGPMTLTDCTVSGNTAKAGGGGGLRSIGIVTLTDCTVSGNTASGGGDGGGLLVFGNTTLDGTTVRDNVARDGGGIFLSDAVADSSVTLLNESGVIENNPNDCAGKTIEGCTE